MMDLAMNFDADECLVTAMFDKGNRNDTMEAIDHIIPFLKGDADMIGLVCNTIRKLFCMSDEGYEVFLWIWKNIKWNWKRRMKNEYKSVCSISGKDTPEYRDVRFRSYEKLKSEGRTVQVENYHQVYIGRIQPGGNSG